MDNFWIIIWNFIKAVIQNGYFQALVMGIVVWYITKRLEHRKENRDYIRQTEIASLEVLNCYKSIIIEEGHPSVEIWFSIHKATAKKYKVHPRDMDNISVIFDDIVKDVMETNFLVYNEKKEFAERILNIKKEVNTLQNQEINNILNEYFDRLVETRRTSLFSEKIEKVFPAFSIIAVIMGLLLTFIIGGDLNFEFPSLSENESIGSKLTSTVTLLTLIAVMFSFMDILSTRMKTRSREKDLNGKNDSNKEDKEKSA